MAKSGGTHRGRRLTGVIVLDAAELPGSIRFNGLSAWSRRIRSTWPDNAQTVSGICESTHLVMSLLGIAGLRIGFALRSWSDCCLKDCNKNCIV